MRNFIAAIILLIAANAYAGETTTKEYYIKIFPADQYAYLKEYNVAGKRSSSSDINKLIEQVKAKVMSVAYCRWKFGFNNWKSAEEAMYKEPEKMIVTGEFHLVTKEKNLVLMLEELFSGLFSRQVSVSISEKEIGIFFKGRDISLAEPNNSLGHYTKAEDNAIYWKNGSSHYEAVFSIKDPNAISLYSDFGSPVKSPELTEAQVDKLKQPN